MILKDRTVEYTIVLKNTEKLCYRILRIVL